MSNSQTSSSSLVLVKRAQTQLLSGDATGAIKTISSSFPSNQNQNQNSNIQTCLASILSQAHFLNGNADEAYSVLLDHTKKLFASSQKVIFISTNQTSSSSASQLVDSQLSSMILLCQIEMLILSSTSTTSSSSTAESFSRDILQFLNSFELNLLSCGENCPNSTRKQKLNQLLDLLFHNIFIKNDDEMKTVALVNSEAKLRTILERLPHLCAFADFKFDPPPLSSSVSFQEQRPSTKRRRVTTIIGPEDVAEEESSSSSSLDHQTSLNNNNNNIQRRGRVSVLSIVIDSIRNVLFSLLRSSRKNSILFFGITAAIVSLLGMLYFKRGGRTMLEGKQKMLQL
jgi:hypothetical protein